jgi:ribosomal protein L37AE/L43A
MLIDFPEYINIKCKKCKITTLHRLYSGYPDIPNRPKNDLAECIVCTNTFILDDWYKKHSIPSSILSDREQALKKRMKMNKEDVYKIPRNNFDIRIIEDKIAEIQHKHDELVETAKSCADKYSNYCETQKELLRSKIPELIFGDCKHTNIKWDKNRYEDRSKGFWVCTNCNEILRRNSWVMETNGGWVSRNEDEIVDKIVATFFEEYPEINIDICDKRNR